MATCRHCGRTIVQHPSGTWVPREGTLDMDPTGIYCQKLPNAQAEMLHEPMPSGLEGAPQLMSPDTDKVCAAANSATDPAHDDSQCISTSALGQDAADATDGLAAGQPRRGAASGRAAPRHAHRHEGR